MYEQHGLLIYSQELSHESDRAIHFLPLSRNACIVYVTLGENAIFKSHLNEKKLTEHSTS